MDQDRREQMRADKKAGGYGIVRGGASFKCKWLFHALKTISICHLKA